MGLYLTPTDVEIIKNKIQEKNAKLEDLGKKLGDAMSRSGSYPSSTPEYAAVHLEMKNIQNNLDYLKSVLSRYSIVEPDKQNMEVVGSYSLVDLVEKNTNRRVGYYLVVPDLNKAVGGEYLIATPESPVGKALLGNRLGDTVKIFLPDGVKEYTITKLAKQY